MNEKKPIHNQYLDSKIKRSVDILTGFAGLPLAVVAIGLVGIAIKLEDGGDVFFHNERVGKEGKIFRIHKLRTYKPDGEKTEVGKKIRPFAIDELPQAYNILKGDMSLFGPRALDVNDFERIMHIHETSPECFDADFISHWKEAYNHSRPGGLSLAVANRSSIYDRNSATDTELRRKMEDDIFQVEHASFKMEMSIAWRILKKVLTK
jgi:lipopolysaccharide/colanic/teichoic acid biosynthesis glycosyltransferase